MELRKNTLIWLNSLGISNANLTNLDLILEGIENIYSLSETYLRKIGLLNDPIISRIISADYRSDIDSYKKLLDKNGINVLTVYDKNYPKALKQIPDKPMIIYTKGRPIQDEEVKIAIVGSRKVSSYGIWATEKFTKELTDLGITIVSGLALGVDSKAHSMTIQNKGNTIGVLGNGLGKVYPRENELLYKSVVNNGTLVSEFPYFSSPKAHNFPARNRIISGLSHAVVVIEAEMRSGTLITARHALDQGKEVFALPGNIDSLTSEGTNLLIKDGAKPLLHIDDILIEIALLKQLSSQNKRTEFELDYQDKKILKILSEGKLQVDSISLMSGINKEDLFKILENLLENEFVHVDNNGYYYKI